MDEFTEARVGKEALKFINYLRSRNLYIDEMLSICATTIGAEISAHRKFEGMDDSETEIILSDIFSLIKEVAYTELNVP